MCGVLKQRNTRNMPPPPPPPTPNRTALQKPPPPCGVWHQGQHTQHCFCRPAGKPHKQTRRLAFVKKVVSFQGPTVDGRNPATPEKPWNDDSPANAGKQWFPTMISIRCRISRIRSNSQLNKLARRGPDLLVQVPPEMLVPEMPGRRGAFVGVLNPPNK